MRCPGKYLFTLLFLCAVALPGAGRAKADGLSLSVTTYNLLGMQFADKSPWEVRRQAVAAIIRQTDNDPDILACQEVQDIRQTDDLAALIADTYDYRDMGIAASPRALFWKRARFELVEGANIDLLDNSPEYTAGQHATSRYAHYVRLRERNSGREVLVYALHVKSGGKHSDRYQQLRYTCVRRLCEVAKARSAELGGLPVIALGDLNGFARAALDGIPSGAMAFVESGFEDTFDLAAERVNAGYKTYSTQQCIDAGLAERASDDQRLDYIFLYPQGCAAVERWSAVINFLPGSRERIERPVPSDHHPVNARIILK